MGRIPVHADAMVLQVHTDLSLATRFGLVQYHPCQDTGADAAKLLNKEFIVAGFKSSETEPTSGISANKVFDHYVVKWTENSAGTTADNTSDWN